jgi:hypothetical protein
MKGGVFEIGCKATVTPNGDGGVPLRWSQVTNDRKGPCKEIFAGITTQIALLYDNRKENACKTRTVRP